MTLMKTKPSRLRCLFAGCCAVLLLPTFAVANPSSREPSKPLATHNTMSEAGDLASSLYGTCAAIEKFVIQSEAMLQDKGAAKLQASVIAQGLWKTEQAGRDANRLQIMGEPAGVDLGLRIADLSQRLAALARAHAATPPGLTLSQKSMAFLERESQNRQREFARLSTMADAQNYAAMEKSLDKFGKELCDGYAYVSGYDLNKYYQPYYSKFRELLETSKTKALRESVDARYTALIEELQPDSAATLAWVTAAVEQLKTTGKATIEGVGSVGGPELVDELIKRWSGGHAALQKVRGLRWAWARDIENQNAKMNAEISQWTDTIAQAFTMIVTASAEIAKPTDVPALHRQYLTRVATIMGITGTAEATKWKTTAEQSLTALLAKNSAYESTVRAYEASTKDLLMFQDRIADQRQATLEVQFAKAENRLRQVAKVEENTPGLYLETPGTISTASLLFPADRTMTTIGPKLVNSFVCLDGVRSISPTSKVSAVRFNGRTYGRALPVPIPDEPLLRTKQELLVDTGHEPLSLEATYALKTIQSGDFTVVGGKVLAFQLDPLVTRLITMTEPTSIIVPHGTTLDPTTEGLMLNQMAVQLDVEPSWVRTKLWIQEIPGKASAASAE